MDPKELTLGIDENLFWHRAKLGLIDILLSKIKRDDLNVLILGCGTGNDIKIISKYSKSITICDIDQNALNSIKYDVEKVNADVTNLSFEDSSFDLIISFDVFEHIDNDQKCIDECFRVLRKGGNLVFTVPSCKFIFSSYDSFFITFVGITERKF